MMIANKKSGFTLVELAIVLVIIGLIIGGVLVGQDLIKAATIRSAITDIEKFNAAATTFRGKYSGLPGDLAAAKAVEFGLAAGGDANSTGAAGLRDGNGVIQDGAGTNLNLSGEIALLWKDLGATGLIGGSYPAIGTAVAPGGAVTLGTVNTYLPRSKLRDSASYFVYSMAGRNYFYMASVTAAAAPSPIAVADAVTPLEAKGIDEKLDDGVPNTGIVLAYTRNGAAAMAVPPSAAPAAVATNALTECATTGSVYNVTTGATGAPSAVNCQLQLRTSF